MEKILFRIYPQNDVSPEEALVAKLLNNSLGFCSLINLDLLLLHTSHLVKALSFHC